MVLKYIILFFLIFVFPGTVKINDDLVWWCVNGKIYKVLICCYGSISIKKLGKAGCQLSSDVPAAVYSG